MEINKNKVGDMSYELTISLNKEDFAVYLDKAFEEVVKNVKADGFRPGKMPKSMFLSRYGYESLYEEAIKQAINETYPQAIDQEKLQAIEMPTIDFEPNAASVENGFTYKAVVCVLPTLENLKYRGFDIKVDNNNVTDEEIQEKINQDLARLTEVVVKEGQAELGDDVVFDFEGFLNGEPFEGGKAENYPLTLGSNQFIPGFEEQLVGVSAGQDIDVNVTFPKEYGHETLAGQAVVFKCHVHEVKAKVVPTLEDEIVQDLEIKDVNTVSEYKDYVVNQLQEQKNKSQEIEYFEKLMTQIYENSKLVIDEEFINRRTAERIEDIKKTINEKYKIEYEMYLQFVGQTPESFEKLQHQDMFKYFRDYFITNQIIIDEKLNPTQEDIERVIAEFAAKQGIKPEEVVKQYSLEQLVYVDLRDKAMNILREANNKVIA